MDTYQSRRAFLRGNWHNQAPAVIRPPWSTAEKKFTSTCTQCNACITACPQQIIVNTLDNFPHIDFQKGSCTFCGQCVEHCTHDALQFANPDKPANAPWPIKMQIGPACLATQNIDCQICKEACEYEAISLSFHRNRVAQPLLDNDTCTGCGACVKRCPIDVISLQQPTATTGN